MTEMLAFNWKKVDASVKLINRELSNADKEFEKRNKIVLENLGHLQQLIEDHDEVGRDEAIDDSEGSIRLPGLATVESSKQDFMPGFKSASDKSVEPVLESIREKEISYLNEKDGPGLKDQQPQNSLLNRAHENLEELKQTTDRKFDSLLKSLAGAKHEVNLRTELQMERTEEVETYLRYIQESLRDLLQVRLSHSRVQSSRPNYISGPQFQM